MRLISDGPELADLAGLLSGAETYYIDTEFESSKRGKTLSLIQVSTGAEVYLVDALRAGDLSPLAACLAREERTWVLHAGLQDVELLLERFGALEPPRLFDTQVAWALLGPESSVSLPYLKFRLLGLRTMKTHQADDWMRRPLPRAQLEYAAADIEQLPEMHRLLRERLEARGRLSAVPEASRELLFPEPEATGELSLASFRNAWQLEPKNQAALVFLIDWYNGLTAGERESAPPPKTFLSIASRLPKTGRDLARVKGIPQRWCARAGDRLARELRRAAERAASEDFELITPPPYATFDAIRLDGWLQMMRAEVSARASVAPELALPPRVVKHIRHTVRRSGDARTGADELTGWRADLLRRAYLDVCERLGSPWASDA